VNVEPLDARTAAVIGTWRYPGRFSTYNCTEPPSRELAVVVRDDDGELLGYGVLGADARVDGLDEAEDTVDVGWGMAPHRMNQGLGRAFAGALTQHADNYAIEQGRALLRAVILDWNEASLRVAGAVGFEPSGELTSLDGRFIVLTRQAARTRVRVTPGT